MPITRLLSVLKRPAGSAQSEAEVWHAIHAGELEFGAVRSDGSRYAATFRAKAPLEWVAGHGGGSDTLPVVRTQRWLSRAFRGLGRDCPKGGIAGAIGGLGIGSLLHPDPAKAAAIGGGAGCVAATLF